MHHSWLELTVRVQRAEERLTHLRDEATTARLLRLHPSRAWQWRLGGWTLRLERAAQRARPA